MARPRTVDPDLVVQTVRDGSFPAEAARQFGISRARVNQILKERAPDLLTPRTAPAPVTLNDKDRRRQMVAETKAALKDNPTLADAARALGLTNSGLNSRMARLGIASPAAKQAVTRQKVILAETKKALKDHEHLTDAAAALGIKVSGLTARRARLGLIERQHDPVI